MRLRSHPSSYRAAFVLAAVLTLTGAWVAYADTPSELDAAKDRLSQIRSQITEEEAGLAELQSELNAIAAEIERARSDLERTESDIASIRSQIQQSRDRLERLRGRLSDRAVEAYIAGPASDLQFLLDASTIGDFSDRMTYLGAVGRQDAELATEVDNQTFELEVRESRLNELLARERGTLGQLEDDQVMLTARFEDQSARIAHLARLRAEGSDLVARLEDRLDQELAAIPPPSSSGGGGGGDGVSGPLYACPVRGPHAYADTFGETHVHEGWTHSHTGNDIIAPYGTPIVAPFDGTAVSSSDATAGLYVTVTGSQGFVQMLHMSSVAQVGQVSSGDVVGYVGETGNASGPHTHFEWHPGGGAAADPYPQLNEVC